MSEHAHQVPLHVCFVRHGAVSLFHPEFGRPPGGAELRALRLATGLAARTGFRVSFLVLSEGQPQRSRFGDIDVIADPAVGHRIAAAYASYVRGVEPLPTFPWLRLKQLKPSLLWQVPMLVLHRTFSHRSAAAADPIPRKRYRELGASVFCCFGADARTADVVASCRKWGMKSVVFVVNETEVSGRVRQGGGYEPLLDGASHLAWYSLRHADRVIVQTAEQAARLAENLGREAVVIPNPLPPLSGTGPVMPREWVLWVGKSEPPHANYKRAELLMELARRCPEVTFRAVINPSHPQRYAALMLERPTNVTVAESVEPVRMGELYAGAVCLVSTSASEGFPNTFLEAAQHGAPTISLFVDPGQLFSRHGLGIACGDDMGKLASEVKRLWTDRGAAAALGRLARVHVEREHNAERCVDRLAEVLSELTGSIP